MKALAIPTIPARHAEAQIEDYNDAIGAVDEAYQTLQTLRPDNNEYDTRDAYRFAVAQHASRLAALERITLELRLIRETIRLAHPPTTKAPDQAAQS